MRERLGTRRPYLVYPVLTLAVAIVGVAAVYVIAWSESYFV